MATPIETATLLESAFLAAVNWGDLERRALVRHLMELRADAEVEVNQFRCLQRAVRGNAALDAELTARGFADVAKRNTLVVDAGTAELIQALNYLIEQGWEP
jgi:hypothetical protein